MSPLLEGVFFGFVVAFALGTVAFAVRARERVAQDARMHREHQKTERMFREAAAERAHAARR